MKSKNFQRDRAQAAALLAWAQQSAQADVQDLIGSECRIAREQTRSKAQAAIAVEYKICYTIGRYERYIWLDVQTEDEARAIIAKQEGVPVEHVLIYWMSKEATR